MEFNPDYWKSHDKGRAVREQILACLPADLETLCKQVERSSYQVKRHLSRLREEGKIRNTTGIISAATIAICVIFPGCGFCQGIESIPETSYKQIAKQRGNNHGILRGFSR